jgi:hypothetical protein
MLVTAASHNATSVTGQKLTASMRSPFVKANVVAFADR